MDQDIEMGEAAFRLLSDPAFSRSVEQFKSNLSDQFFASSPSDHEGRERLFNLRLCLDAVLGNLQGLYLTAQQAVQLSEINGND